MKKEFSEKNNGNLKLIILSTLIGITVTAIAVFIFGFIMYITELSSDFAVILATVSVALGCFAASFYAANTIKQKGFFIGLIVGGIVFTIITIISLLIDKGAIGINTLFHFVIFMLSSLTGGIVGVNKAINKKYI